MDCELLKGKDSMLFIFITLTPNAVLGTCPMYSKSQVVFYFLDEVPG